jgi:hypothetical protein
MGSRTNVRLLVLSGRNSATPRERAGFEAIGDRERIHGASLPPLAEPSFPASSDLNFDSLRNFSYSAV